jgi:uncharacterized membrane protein
VGNSPKLLYDFKFFDVAIVLLFVATIVNFNSFRVLLFWNSAGDNLGAGPLMVAALLLGILGSIGVLIALKLRRKVSSRRAGNVFVQYLALAIFFLIPVCFGALCYFYFSMVV